MEYEEINDTIWYFVSGLGCDLRRNEEREIIDWISSKTNIPEEKVKFRCHKSTSALKCIAKTYLNMMPLKDSKFVNNLVDEITEDINKPDIKSVVIFSHSFGGAMVNKAAEILNDSENMNINKLNIATFGSIYLAPEENIVNLNMFNYLSISDVAIKCNQVVPARLDRMNIYLLLNRMIVCQLLKENTSKLIQLCLYDVETGKQICLPNFVSILRWNEHNYYSYVMQTILLNFIRSRTYEQRDINFINVYDSKKLLRGQKQEDDIPYLIGYSKKEILNNPTESLSVPSSPSSLSEDLYTNAMGKKTYKKRKYKTKKYSKYGRSTKRK
jgi:Fe-S cluster biosynthesis and repair protein YggX